MIATPCIEYTGRFDKDGYGVFWRDGTPVLAHRDAAAKRYGAAAIVGKVVRHSCDNPACINEDHLLIGTQADNMQDKVERGRQAKADSLPQAKLTYEDAAVIRARYIGKGGPSMRALAVEFGVSSNVIYKVIHRQTFK